MSGKTRAQVLEDAAGLVNGVRNAAYDEPFQNFARIAGLWSAYLGLPINATDVAILNLLQKVGRLMHTPDHWDSWVDLAGYAACGADVAGATTPTEDKAPKWDTPLGRITSLEDDGNGLRMEGQVYPEWESVIKQRTEGTK